jgi:hypothetical protein
LQRPWLLPLLPLLVLPLLLAAVVVVLLPEVAATIP